MDSACFYCNYFWLCSDNIWISDRDSCRTVHESDAGGFPGCFCQYYDIKRVIGLPEEKVRISNGDIYINGERRSDVPFEMAIQISGVAEDEITLGEDEYFVMGDNVNNSEDSRYTNVGNISKTEITGKVVSIVLPRSDKGKVK